MTRIHYLFNPFYLWQSFDPSNIGAASYSIELDCYQSSDFNGTFGVMDPVNQWSFNEGDDSLITINHTISARGFKTSNSAITNAKNFVSGRIGGLTNISLFQTGESAFLMSRDEKINKKINIYLLHIVKKKA